MIVSRWGNALAVRLPKALVDQLGLKAGEELEIVEAQDRRLVVDRRQQRADAMRELAGIHVELPEGYRFSREEANSR
jgi:antitoxin MazE